MMRKLLLSALMTVLLGLLPFAAMGEITVETISEGSGKLATNRYAFQQEIPLVVKTQLALHGYEDVHCVSGLALERLVLEYPQGQENAYRSSDALLITEKDGVYSILGLRWHFADQKGWLAEYGSLGLSLEKGFQLAFQPARLKTVDFALSAECEENVRTWRMNVTGENVWYIAACETPGGETVRWSEFDGGFALDDGLHPACWWPQLEGMDRFGEYPVTQRQAAELAERSWRGLPREKLAVLGGNLREEPTGRSRSLGVMQGAVLGELLGEQQPGLYEPWFRVRVGHTVGWVSATYVHPLAGESGENMAGSLRPLDTAVILQNVPLRYSMDDHTPVTVLEAGTEVQVLSQTEDEWVHVVVPTARSTRCMDMNGTYGYVRLDELKLP